MTLIKQQDYFVSFASSFDDDDETIQPPLWEVVTLEVGPDWQIGLL